MKAVAIRIAGIVCGVSVVAWICHILQVPIIQISALAGWGLTCLLFSYEFAGRRRVMRRGFEDRSWLERAWLAAGGLCLVAVFMLIVLYL